MTDPDPDDVVIREEHGNPSSVYLLGTSASPDQFILRTRDRAVSQAVAYAKRQHVRAWFTKDDETFVLLGTFREDDEEPVRLSEAMSDNRSREAE
jgi:hypothetical protein